MYLREAAIEFLEYSGKHNGNKLERDVYQKLQDEAIICQLKADSVMFYHVYADLVMLSKSSSLNKDAYSMNQHYLELKLFLQELEQDPELVMTKGLKVFESEQQLYGNDKKLNHRLHTKSKHVHQHLFIASEKEKETLFPMVSSGAAAMKAKLCNYAKNQLPGGKYWNPEEKIKEILKTLNDYLTTALPNLHQMTKSNLTEIKKNKTMTWLDEQPQSIQGNLIEMACKRRDLVMKEYKEEEDKQSIQRRERMLLDKRKRDGLQARREKERNKLSTIHLITDSEELSRTLLEIDNQQISASQKKAKKMEVLKTQIKIRKQVLLQKVPIMFTHCRKPRAVHEIAKELSLFIDHNESPRATILHDPALLVGRHIQHRFALEDGCHAWFNGIVQGFDATSNLHEVLYENEDEVCYYDLTQDLIMGDLILL